MATIYQRLDLIPDKVEKNGCRTSVLRPKFGDLVERLAERGYDIKCSTELLNGFPSAIILVGADDGNIREDFLNTAGSMAQYYQFSASAGSIAEVTNDKTFSWY